jgi:hypothetical protein
MRLSPIVVEVTFAWDDDLGHLIFKKVKSTWDIHLLLNRF